MIPLKVFWSRLTEVLRRKDRDERLTDEIARLKQLIARVETTDTPEDR